jgi:hypothetical protein
VDEADDEATAAALGLGVDELLAWLLLSRLIPETSRVRISLGKLALLEWRCFAYAVFSRCFWRSSAESFCALPLIPRVSSMESPLATDGGAV